MADGGAEDPRGRIAATPKERGCTDLFCHARIFFAGTH